MIKMINKIIIIFLFIFMKYFKMPNYNQSCYKKYYNFGEMNNLQCVKDICLFVDNINKTYYQVCINKYTKPEQKNNF